MEMNRYLLAALYVMAGCAVTIPLKAQANGEPLRGERCRLVITNTVKIVSVCMEEEEVEVDFCGLLPDYFRFPSPEICSVDFSFERIVRIYAGPLCPTSHKIRAPEFL